MSEETAQKPLDQGESHTEANTATPVAENPEGHSAAYLLAQKGGRAGGPARARALSPERRSEIARLAANARWNRYRAERA